MNEQPQSKVTLTKVQIENILELRFDLKVEAVIILDAEGVEIPHVVDNCDVSIAIKGQMTDKRCLAISRFLAHLVNMTLDEPEGGEGNPHVEHFLEHNGTAFAFHTCATPPVLQTFIREASITFSARTAITAETIEDAHELSTEDSYTTEAYDSLIEDAYGGVDARDIEWHETRELEDGESDHLDANTDLIRHQILFELTGRSSLDLE